jgi:hypothetical protein
VEVGLEAATATVHIHVTYVTAFGKLLAFGCFDDVDVGVLSHKVHTLW